MRGPAVDAVARLVGRAAGPERLLGPGAGRDEDETLALLLPAVGAWGARHVDDRRIDAEHTIPRAVLDGAAALGLFGLTIPAEHGGAELSLRGAARVIEELATFDRSLAVSIGVHCGLGVRSLVRHGSEALKAEFLPALARGERLAAFALTEPGAGSSMASVQTRARWDGNGTLHVSGSKLFVTNGGFADTFTVVARTPAMDGRRPGHSLLLVTRETAGVHVGREEDKLGLRGSSTTPIDFEDVAVPLARVIGEPSRGLAHLGAVLPWGRTFLAAGCLGLARAALRRAVERAKTRIQFGRPIAVFGQIREKVARMRAAVHAMESLLAVVTQLEHDDGPDIDWESAAVKIYCTEAAWRVADEALQLHGGSGFIEDTGMARLLRDARIGRIFEGTNEVLRLHLAAAARGGLASAAAPLRLAARVAPTLADLAAEFDVLHETVRATIAAIAEQGLDGIENQMRLRELSDAQIALYTLGAVVVRTDAELRADRGEGTLPLARYLAIVLGRTIARGLAGVRRADEEALVRDISEAEYEEVRP